MARTNTFPNPTSPSPSGSEVQPGFSPGEASAGTLAPRTLVMTEREEDPIPGAATPAGGGLMTHGDERGTSDEDEEYSDLDSSASGASTQPPNLADLILLDEGRCRAPMRSKIPSGAKVACICGRLALDCKRHADYRISNDEERAEPGYYLRAVGVKGEHGLQGVRYPVEYIDELRALQDHEINRAAQTLAMDDEDPDDPQEEPGFSPRRVSFGAPTTQVAGRGTRQAGHHQVVDLSRSPTGPPPSILFGLTDAAGGKWVLTELDTARKYEDTGAFQLAKVFTNQADAEQWKGDQGRHAKGRTSKSYSRSPKDPSSSSSSSSDHSSSGSRRTDRRKAPPREKSRSRSRQTGKEHRKEFDSDTTSSDSSGSASTNSLSPDPRRRRRNKKHSRRSRKGGGRRKPTPQSPDAERSKLRGCRTGEDKSVGNKDLIHGLSVHGREIDAVLGPEDMRLRDADELYNAAMDVTSLPGMFGSVGGVHFTDDMQGATEMAATLLSTAIGKKAQIHDSLWKTQKRHALGQIKDVKSLFTLVKNVNDAKRPALDQQEHALQVFLRTRRYDDDYTQEYVRTGFLVQLTTTSLEYYLELLNTARQLAYDYKNVQWEGGPAKAMLEFHAKKLLEIRMFALTRKMLILRTYTYLRDASKQSFFDNRMNEALWKQVVLTTEDPNDSGDQREKATPKERSGEPKMCSQCKSKRLHQLMRVKHQRSSCPFKDLTPKEAKDQARKALHLFDEDTDMEGGIQEAVRRVQRA